MGTFQTLLFCIAGSIGQKSTVSLLCCHAGRWETTPCGLQQRHYRLHNLKYYTICAVQNSKHESRSDRAVGPIFSLPTSNRTGGTRGATHGHYLSTVLVIRSPHPFATWVADHEATVLGLCPDTKVPITICNTYSCPTFQRQLHRAVQDTHSRTDTKCLLVLAVSNGTANAWPCPYRAFISIRIAVFILQHFSRLRCSLSTNGLATLHVVKNPQFSVHNFRYNAKLYFELLNLIYRLRNPEPIHPATIMAFLSSSRQMPKAAVTLEPEPTQHSSLDRLQTRK